MRVQAGFPGKVQGISEVLLGDVRIRGIVKGRNNMDYKILRGLTVIYSAKFGIFGHLLLMPGTEVQRKHYTLGVAGFAY
jgi:hypothetical protein